jgi:hypothetical protein
MVRLESRGDVSRAWSLLSPVVAIVLTLISGVVIFSAMGKDPGLALYTYFVQPLTTAFGITELLVKATPLVLIGIGLSIGFRAHRRRRDRHRLPRQREFSLASRGPGRRCFRWHGLGGDTGLP